MKKEELITRICLIGCYLVLGLIQIVKLFIHLIRDRPNSSKQQQSMDIYRCYHSDDICYHVKTIDQRNRIPIDQRHIGMIVYVVETDCSYVLETNPLTKYTSDRHWCQAIKTDVVDLSNSLYICA